MQGRRGEGHSILAMGVVLLFMLSAIGALESSAYVIQTRIANNIALTGALSISQGAKFDGNGLAIYDSCGEATRAICMNVNCNDQEIRVICRPVTKDIKREKSRHTGYDIYVVLPFRSVTPLGLRWFGGSVVGYSPATLSYGIAEEEE